MAGPEPRAAAPRRDFGVTAPGVTWANILLPLAAAAVALAVALVAIRPMSGPPLAYDTFASVVHFDRIVSGRQLESGLGTTPKPLLTFALGLAHAAGGWVGVSLASIVAWATAVGLGTALAMRLAGIAGGAAVAALLVASPTLLLETGWGLASTWGLGLWFAAGLATLSPRPRWALIGLLLGLATLARLETLLLIGFALGVVLVRWLVQSAGRRRWPGLSVRPRLRTAIPAGPWRMALGLVALPVMLAHDALLTGDPFYWLNVSAAFGNALASVGALPDAWSAARQVLAVPSGVPVQSVLALVGLVVLLDRRAWAILLGLVALGPGMGVFLVVLAASGRFADPRYLVPIQAAILVAAAIGIGALASSVVGWLGRAGRREARSRATGPRAMLGLGRAAAVSALVIGGAGMGLLASPTIGPLDGPTQATLARFQVLAHSADLAAPALRQALAGFASARLWPGTARLGDRSRTDIFSVPGNLRPRLALDLDVPLTRLVATDATRIDPAQGVPEVGQIVLHSGGDLPAAPFRVFEIDTPTRAGAVILVPLFHDAAAETWVVRIDTSYGLNQKGVQTKR